MAEINVDITAKMGFDIDTVNRCLTIVEWYLNDNPQSKLIHNIDLNSLKHTLKIENPLINGGITNND